MTIEELKIRQLTNQHLITPSDKMTVIHDLCGVQAQFMPNAFTRLKFIAMITMSRRSLKGL